MSNIEVGMLAKSLAGHDKDNIYFIYGVNNEYVDLVDGRLRNVDNPKRKKLKHIQVIKLTHSIEETAYNTTGNEIIKKLIKEYKREHN